MSAGPMAIARQVAEEGAACPDLALASNILDQFVELLPAIGLVGEERNAKLLYLAITTRFFARPVSVGFKGPSSGGKSYTVEQVLRFFPSEAYYALTAMSEKALAYSEEPLAHRILVLYEAVALSGEWASYFVRTLLSEGHIRYEYVDKRTLKPKLIEKEGPTGLIVTTTRIKLHPENETRMLSILADDSPDQTAGVMRRLAVGLSGDVDLNEWLALQRWLKAGEHRVTIPYASRLADLIPPVAVRLRRDFTTVLDLMMAHAVLHQATREQDENGAVVATLVDYAVVRDLVADLISEGVGATVSETVRQTVAAVSELKAISTEQVTYKRLGDRLGLDKSAAQRRALAAIDGGYLRNNETQKGRPADLLVGDPLPDEVAILPEAADLSP